MRAILYSHGASADVLKLEEIDKPLPADDEVLIKIRAAAKTLGGEVIPELVKWRFVSQKSVSLMAKLDTDHLNVLGALIAEGKVKPVIDRRYRLSEVSRC